MRKGKILISAVIIGCIGVSLGMFPKEKIANASILVYDQENILQAMKTAVNTASILTSAQKQLALQVLDMTSISASSLEKLLLSQTKTQQTVFDENSSKVGALNTNTSTSTYWQNNFSNIKNVLEGNMTAVDAYEANQKALKALEQTNQDALHGAKTTQVLQNNTSNTINDALTASANASGTKEALQANTQTIAAAAYTTMYGNNLLSEILATNATKYQKEVQDEANAIAVRKQVADQMQSDVDSMKAAVGGTQ